MSKINLKTDYKDGQILHGDELNVNNTVTMQGVNDNFDRINNLSKTKADTTYVDNVVAEKVDESSLNRKLQELDYIKADKTELAKKANQSEVDLKANKKDVDVAIQSKADKTYVDINLNSKANKTYVDGALDLKANQSVVGDLDDLNTTAKGNLVEAINSVNRETLPIATTDNVGMVKPDGSTITIDQDGTMHSIGGGGSGSGTTDYNALSNKPSLNGIELKGAMMADDLKLMSKSDINAALANKANKDDVYSKEDIDIDIKIPLENKADKTSVAEDLANKADIENVYNKTTVNEMLNSLQSSVNAQLVNKADIGDNYTKDEVNNLVDEKADGLSFYDNNLQLKSGDKLIGDPVKVEVATTDIIISSEQPPIDEDFKVWIDNGEVDNLGSEVVNSMSGNENNKAPSVNATNKATGITGWSNPNPNTTFPSQSITLNSVDYDDYEIEFLLVSNSPESKSTGRIIKTNRAYLDYVGGSNSLVGYMRKVSSISRNVINFSDAININSNTVDNTRCIPQRVILYIK